MRVSVHDDLGNLNDKLDSLGRGIFPNLEKSIRISTSLIERTWVNLAMGNDQTGKPSGLSFSGNIDYARSIRIHSHTYFSAEVVSDSMVGKSLQEGSPQKDMKPDLVGGPKARTSEDGERYNIIPFRHKIDKLKRVNITNDVGNVSLYSLARELKQQEVTGTKKDDMGVKRLTYRNWSKEKSLSLKDKRYDRYHGLVRMSQNTPGSQVRSKYLTFRIVTLAQSGKWVRRSIPPWDIVGVIVSKTKNKVDEIINQGIMKDLEVK